MDRFAHDIRIALRGFRRTPTFAATAVVILGLGIGMAVAMFAVFHAVLLRKLPVRDQDRIVVMWAYHDPGLEFPVLPKDIDELRRSSRTMSAIAGYAHWPASGMPWTDGERSIELNRSLVSGNFFDVLGARPALGRFLRPEDEPQGAPRVLVISYAAWRQHFGGDSSIVGHQLTDPYSQQRYTIVGVAPPGLDFPVGVGYWGTLWPGPVPLDVIARLAPGATPSAAKSEFFATSKHIEPERNLRGATAFTFSEAVVGDVRLALLVLTAAVALLLLIACVNVGNLLLLRAATRSREIAIRRALGASYGDVVRQLLVESGLLALAGGALGLLAAEGLLRVLLAVAPERLPRTDVIRVTGAPVGIAIGVTLAAVLVFGLVPALTASRGNLASPLRLDARSGHETRQRRRVRQWLVASQVALALVMLAGAALLVRSLERLEHVDLGYRPEHLSIVSLSFATTRYKQVADIIPPSIQLMSQWRAIPGVSMLTPIVLPPMYGNNVFQWKFVAQRQSQAEADANPTVAVEGGDADYFRTFGIPILRGRGFLDTDVETAPPVLVVSKTIARRYWPGQDPIGKRLRLPGATSATPGDSSWRTVVGVVDDPHLRLLREATPTIFFPWRQAYWQGAFAVRTTTDLAAVLPAMRREMRAVDPLMTLWYVRTMDQLLAGPLAQPRLSTLLLSGFGLVALVLAAVGLYGVMASSVREETREIGVRMALGATPERVRREVLRRALSISGVGAIVGITGALATSHLLTKLLFQVSPTDPIALLGACVLLLGVALVAAYLPARSATRVDPARALRAD